MDRFRALFPVGNLLAIFAKKEDEAEYEPLATETSFIDDQPESHDDAAMPAFSWLEYGIFALLGVAMLWAW